MSQTEFVNFEDLSDIIENDDGSLEIEFGNPEYSPESTEHYENLAELFDENDLNEISTMVIEYAQADKESRSNWEMMTLDFIDNLGLVYEEGNEPFDGACTATHPLILESCVKFQSKISNELLPPGGPVKTKIIGRHTEERQKQARRIKDDLNHQLTEVITEFEPESEKTFFITSFVGNAFKKSYWDPLKGRVCNEMIIDKLFVNHNATSLQDAERITHCYFMSKRRMQQMISSKNFIYYDIDADLVCGVPETSQFEDRLREVQGIASESKLHDEVFTIIEQHIYLPVDETKYILEEKTDPKPYVVTIDQGSGKVLSIRRNWAENDSNKKRLEWFTHYCFVPTAGFYGLGYAHLLGNLQKTLTVTMRSLADAGMFANLSAGFKSKHARIIDDGGPISPGEFKDVEIPAVADLSKVFLPLPFKEPSIVLFQVMQELTRVGQKFADSTEQVIADSTNYGPVGTTMALLEASTRFYAAVYKRQYKAQSQEFKIIARLIKEFDSDTYPYLVDEEQEYSRSEDYDFERIAIIPVSDPNYSSQAQRISKAQVILETAMRGPQVHDMRGVFREVYSAFEVENIDKLVPPESKPEKREPIDDLMAALRGLPIAAFQGQDHDSHIIIKTAWLQDPANGGSEDMAQFRPVIMANIREHKFLKYQTELGALQAQGLGIEEAAQRLSRLNQLAEEEKEKGSPASILAKAELLKAQVQAVKEQREAKNDQLDFGIKLLDTSAELEREINRAQEAGRKIDNEKLKIATDLIKAGLQETNKKEANEARKADSKQTNRPFK